VYFLVYLYVVPVDFLLSSFIHSLTIKFIDLFLLGT
jgi:hypothetical protein